MITAVGHLVSWASEFSLILVFASIAYFGPHGGDVESALQLLFYLFPCINLVVFPLIQVVSSTPLRESLLRAWRSIRTNCYEPGLVVYC